MKTKAFTLIEIMVVISIITLLSSVVSVNLLEARAKADDSKKVQEVLQVKNAITLQKDTTGFVPKNYNLNGSYSPSGGGNMVAKEGTQAFNASMQELVTNKYLTAIPDSKDDSYVYFASSTTNTATFGAPLKAVGAVANPNSNSCPNVPAVAPYSSCSQTNSAGSVFLNTTATQALCQTNGPTNVCYPNAANQITGLSCSGVSMGGVQSCFTYNPDGSCAAYIISGGRCQYQLSGLTETNYCMPSNAISTCSGGGKDTCACI